MRANNPDLFRPLSASVQTGGFAVSLRQDSLRCVRCNQIFRQHDVQEFDGGVRFVCACCGLDALEMVPA